jgi:hypothetical protein
LADDPEFIYSVLEIVKTNLEINIRQRRAKIYFIEQQYVLQGFSVFDQPGQSFMKGLFILESISGPVAIVLVGNELQAQQGRLRGRDGGSGQ